jgi:uridine kinase
VIAGTDARSKVIARVADHLVANSPGHPLRVAVDGITAAGKSTLADELALAITLRGRPSVRLSMDGYHNARAYRYRQGRDSAAGYYQDAYDFGSLATRVLMPLGPGGARCYQPAIIDLATDQTVADDPLEVSPAAVLVVDGSFLQRAELDGLWDEIVFVDTAFEVAQSRGARRDHAANRIYLTDRAPEQRADVVISNDDLECPVIRRIGGPAEATVSLFSYGTLQLSDVQHSSFGRQLDGHGDTLPGHRSDWVTITDAGVIAASGTDRHPIVRPTGDAHDQVPGTVFTITATELAAADHYEVSDYYRTLVRLGSGTPAWVYLDARHPR